ncbi:MAG: L-lactate dehydrogenase [Clostridia bacterium]
MKREKAVVIGSGFVGSTIAYTLAAKGIFDDIGLIDIDVDKAEGDAADISHGVSFVKPVSITSGGYDLCKDADMIVITAGVGQKKGETRRELLERNAVVFKSITDKIKENAKGEPLVMVVSNPVDVLTYMTWKMLGYDKSRVFGSGTVLDTSRMKYLLGKCADIDMRNIHTYVIGEHGDSSVPVWSATSIAGLRIEEFAKTHECVDIYEIPQKVREAAYDVIDKKGATYYAIALAVSRICEAITGDEKSVLTVSKVMEGEYSLNDVAISIPTIVGGMGAGKVIELPLSKEEKEGLEKSAEIMKGQLRDIGF